VPLYALGDVEPDIHPEAYVHPDAVVIGDVTLGAGAIVAAGAVVSPGAEIPPRRMALGVPARVREGYEVPEGVYDHAVQSYLQRGKRFRAELRRLEG
jgi:carbonic anhydrase/acetyltransferase-like protein (isoleucine patch superfamily)